jgi:hypothetical protein
LRATTLSKETLIQRVAFAEASSTRRALAPRAVADAPSRKMLR